MPYTPKNVDEYLDLLDQAAFEMDDLIACANDELDDEFVVHLGMYQNVAAELRKLRAAVAAGGHRFGAKEDLEFMARVRGRRNAIPFYDLLETLNRVHRAGF